MHDVDKVQAIKFLKRIGDIALQTAAVLNGEKPPQLSDDDEIDLMETYSIIEGLLDSLYSLSFWENSDGPNEHDNTFCLDVVAEMAESFDKDPELQKYASALDELLITIAAPKDWQGALKKLEDSRLDELKKKYNDIREISDEKNKIAGKEYEKALKDSPKLKEVRVLSEPLDNRYCPDHAGVQVMRVGDRTWQCSLDGKVYSYIDGFEKLNGQKVPGSSVENQSNLDNYTNQIFDFTSREDRLGDKK